jgi:hypothetical protein
MMYPPSPPWAGWYRPWVPLPMHFHPGWSEPAEGFGHEGHYAGDGRYVYVSHQQDRRALGQENRTDRSAKLDHPVSPKTTTAHGHRHEQEAPKDMSIADESGSSQG